MTKRDFSLLVMRLMAIWVITGAFGHFAMGLGGLVPFVLQVGWGLFLWMFSMPLARMMMEERNEEQSVASWTVREAARLGLALIGFSLLVQGISQLGNIVFQAFFGGLGVGALTFVWSGLPQLTCGAVLLFGARVFSYWLAPRDVLPSTSD